MNREHLKIEYNEKYNFNKVTCTEGHFITNWDGSDYKAYTASTIMYAPVSVNLDKFYCITETEHKANLEKQREAIDIEIREEEFKRLTGIISGTTM